MLKKIKDLIIFNKKFVYLRNFLYYCNAKTKLDDIYY